MGTVQDSDGDVLLDSDFDPMHEDNQPSQIVDSDNAYLYDSNNQPIFYLPREKRA